MIKRALLGGAALALTVAGMALGQTPPAGPPFPLPEFDQTVYDNANWGFIENPQDRSGLGTFDKDKMKVNDDGSVDIYVGPKAPVGLESNWIPTMDKKPYIWLRLYGPDEPFWKKTWKLPDLVRVK